MNDNEGDGMTAMPWCERCQCYHHATADCIVSDACIMDTELFEPRKLPCGCCTNGCICTTHSRPELLIHPRFCQYHLEEKMREEFKRRSVGDGVALHFIPHPPGLIDKIADAITSGKLKLP